MWQSALYILFAYLIGAIPTGYLIAKQLKGIDIREHGSGNVGATNVKRVVGPKAGLATLILDFFKGFLTVLGALWLFPPSIDPYQLTAVFTTIAAVVGHSRSIYIGFSGGKSVITSLGALIALQPLAALIAAGVAVLTIKLTRYVSVGSMLGALLIPLLAWIFHAPLSHVLLCSFVGLYVVYLHRANIYRLLHHQENRI